MSIDAAIARRQGDAAEERIALSPTESLVLEVLAARHRLGDTPYHLSTRHRQALRTLGAKGLVGSDHGIVEGHDKAWLTEAGIVYALTPRHVPPVLSVTCRSFYLGPRTRESRVDCTLRSHHDGPHRASVYAAGSRLGEVVQEPVAWADHEAKGYDSALFGAECRRMDAERRARFKDAVDRFDPGADVEDYLRLA